MKINRFKLTRSNSPLTYHPRQDLGKIHRSMNQQKKKNQNIPKGKISPHKKTNLGTFPTTETRKPHKQAKKEGNRMAI